MQAPKSGYYAAFLGIEYDRNDVFGNVTISRKQRISHLQNYDASTPSGYSTTGRSMAGIAYLNSGEEITLTLANTSGATITLPVVASIVKL